MNIWLKLIYINFYSTMPELGFEDSNGQLTTTGLGDMSPDSVIFSANSNFSTFSSPSGSVERDVQDHSSEISQQLAIRKCHETCSGGIDPKNFTVHTNNLLCRQEKITVQEEDSKVEREKKNQVLDSARSSFSQALKDCQVRRARSETLLKKPDKRRPASVDLNNTMANATSSSPHHSVMKKSFVSTQQTCFLTPETPSYPHQNISIQKGWNSERVALPTSTNRRNANDVSFPFSNGRRLPSKWEDAERWIFSPVSGDGAMRPSFPQLHRRPRSKSGPLGPSGTKYSSMYSPAMHMSDRCNDGNLMVANTLTDGVTTTDSLSIQCGEGHGGNVRYHAFMEPSMGRSVSIHGCSEMLCQSILPSFHGGELDSVEDEASNRFRYVSKRDMATQVSSEGSSYSPSRGKPFSRQYSSVLPIMEYQNFHPSQQEIRDVQIDGRVIMTRPRKHIARNQGKALGNVDDWKKRALEITSARWEVSDTAKSISKIKREEARIIAWENLQNAKAEAAIQKLEMKLEKKRSSSIDKIMNKLRSSQRKAQEMRSSMSVYQSHQVAKPSNKIMSCHKTSQIGSLSGCFTCHAF